MYVYIYIYIYININQYIYKGFEQALTGLGGGQAAQRWRWNASGLRLSPGGTARRQRPASRFIIEDFCLKNGSSQGRNLAVTVLFVPNSLDSGMQKCCFFLRGARSVRSCLLHSGDTNPCRMTGVTLHSHVRYITGCRHHHHSMRSFAIR